MGKAPEEEHPVKAFGWAARGTSGVLSPFKCSRRVTGDEDVRFKILYCGICHSDLHSLKNEWGNSTYPLLPGHEVVGVVTEVGSKTYGGYSDHMVANERYIVRIPDNLPLDAAAPLLCAGITTYSPLRYMGLISLVQSGCGGPRYLSSHAGVILTVEILNSCAGTIVVSIEVSWKDHHGWAPDKPLELPIFPLIIGRKTIAGSCIGGMKETQEMIDFAGKHNISPLIEVIPMDYVNTAIERLIKADVKYRFVLDVGNTLKAA
ncbi:hypothetical protein C3L33_18030, partial [Rhododendron williamsianum]